MSTETKAKRTRKVKDTTRIIESLKSLSFTDKKDVLTALQSSISEQAAEMKAQAEATLKLINS